MDATRDRFRDPIEVIEIEMLFPRHQSAGTLQSSMVLVQTQKRLPEFTPHNDLIQGVHVNEPASSTLITGIKRSPDLCLPAIELAVALSFGITSKQDSIMRLAPNNPDWPLGVFQILAYFAEVQGLQQCEESNFNGRRNAIHKHATAQIHPPIEHLEQNPRQKQEALLQNNLPFLERAKQIRGTALLPSGSDTKEASLQASEVQSPTMSIQ
nr:hypothetical protein Iba_chr01dCG17410 [Ipomoea batatas]